MTNELIKWLQENKEELNKPIEKIKWKAIYRKLEKPLEQNLLC